MQLEIEGEYIEVVATESPLVKEPQAIVFWLIY
ncbi:MAG: hypothetical protein UZ12_BCD005000958, partial [Bacteroidetes bacterium OLB12]